MKSIGYLEPGPADRPDAFVERDLPDPVATGRDLLVRVEAVSVNPVDTHLRRGAPAMDGFRVLGFDAVGTVEAIGPEVTQFKRGDKVWYAGAVQRQGSNAELQLVDERIVGYAPKSLGARGAAALPLTALTASEMLFDRLDVRRAAPGDNRTILIVGGAGGVGSIAIQMARRLAGMTVIATASRPESAEWALRMGAHHVIDHSRPLGPQVEQLETGSPGFILSTMQTGSHADDLADLIAPEGRLGVITDLAVSQKTAGTLFGKSITLCYELMFTRPRLAPADMAEQGRILTDLAGQIDAGTLQTTAGEHFGQISAEALRRAHAYIETGHAIGKPILDGL